MTQSSQRPMEAKEKGCYKAKAMLHETVFRRQPDLKSLHENKTLHHLKTLTGLISKSILQHFLNQILL